MYAANNWLSTTSETLDIRPDSWCVIHASGPANIVLEGIDAHGEAIPLQSGNNWVMRQRLQSFTKLHIHSSKPFGFSIELSEVRGHEPTNNIPPYERPIPKNPLAQARERIRMELGAYRETFENETLFPGYELSDDDDELYEEEIYERSQKPTKARTEAKAPKEVLDSSKPPSASPEPSDGLHEQS